MSIVYFAGPFSERSLFQRWRSDITRDGHQSVARWIDEVEEDEADYRSYAVRDLEDIDLCDTLLAYNPEVRRNTRGGNFFETGYAYGVGKRLMLTGVRGNVFHHLSNVEYYPTWSKCKEAL